MDLGIESNKKISFEKLKSMTITIGQAEAKKKESLV